LARNTAQEAPSPGADQSGWHVNSHGAVSARVLRVDVDTAGNKRLHDLQLTVAGSDDDVTIIHPMVTKRMQAAVLFQPQIALN
jgi:hypothetical protein